MSTFTVLKPSERSATYQAPERGQLLIYMTSPWNSYCRFNSAAMWLLSLIKLSGVAMFSVAGSPGTSQSIWRRFLSRRSDIPSQSLFAHSQVSVRLLITGVDGNGKKWGFLFVCFTFFLMQNYKLLHREDDHSKRQERQNLNVKIRSVGEWSALRKHTHTHCHPGKQAKQIFFLKK